MPKKSKIIIILGLLTALIPFLGFPGAVRDIIIVVFSLIISMFGFIYLIKERRVARKGENIKNEEKPETFVDNGHQFNPNDNKIESESEIKNS